MAGNFDMFGKALEMFTGGKDKKEAPAGILQQTERELKELRDGDTDIAANLVQPEVDKWLQEQGITDLKQVEEYRGMFVAEMRKRMTGMEQDKIKESTEAANLSKFVDEFTGGIVADIEAKFPDDIKKNLEKKKGEGGWEGWLASIRNSFPEAASALAALIEFVQSDETKDPDEKPGFFDAPLKKAIAILKGEKTEEPATEKTAEGVIKKDLPLVEVDGVIFNPQKDGSYTTEDPKMKGVEFREKEKGSGIYLSPDGKKSFTLDLGNNKGTIVTLREGSLAAGLQAQIDANDAAGEVNDTQKKPGSTVFLGDSITTELTKQKFDLNGEVAEIAEGSQTVNWILSRLGITQSGVDEQTVKTNREKIKSSRNVVLLIGTNDVGGNTEAKDIFEKIQQAWKGIKEINPNIKLFACTIPPQGAQNLVEEKRIALNEMIRNASSDYGTLIDFAKRESEGGLADNDKENELAENMRGDNVHPKDEKLAAIYQKALNEHGNA